MSIVPNHIYSLVGIVSTTRGRYLAAKFLVHMKRITQTLTTALFCLTLFSCKKDNDEKKVDPANANELQSVLVIPGGSLTGGNPPAPTNTSTSPQIGGSQSSGSVNAGGQVSIPFNYASNSGYTNCYVQVNGATNGYFNIPANSTSNSGAINIPVNVPSSVNSGQFCVTYCIADAQGRVSNYQTYCVNVTGTSTGTNNPGVGSGSFKYDGQTYTGVCQSTGTDVVIASQSGQSFVIYNMPTSTSGSFNFKDGYQANGTTDLWGALNGATFFGATKPTGSVTRTGAKSFTFSTTVYDLNTNQQKSVTGSGTWQ